ncbi:pentapeptide repeat-containing protein [Sulfitobacter sp. CW3]|uniref:pentapeptide repeat-containing protein n=1 Tax=Sulfitobacter sp. CW3 TaxID=2861965 RepID=UPI001C5F2A56|nr:pentapeptide repeat-containing protein [Sulfitobacter sp. CW3]MBW4963994.1 pentapeptide repeat-containing protein [Sulfitobacter sp. CW3]
MLVLLAASLLTASALTFYLVEIAISVSGLVDRLHAAANDPSKTPEDLRHLGTTVALLMGVLAAAATIFFSIIRVWINERTASAAEEALFNDKINNAVNDLHAQRQVTLWDEADRPTGWQDDVTRRNGAIDRLEGLAGEEPKAAPRIARMLAVYVRELSREHPPEDAPSSDDPIVLRDWARALTPARSDMQNAVQVLGRLKKTTSLPLDSGEIDLTGANLQGFDLRQLDFDRAKMQGAKLQGANLSSAQLQGANLFSAQLQGADLIKAQLQGAYLIKAQLQGASLWEAQLQGAILLGAELQRTQFDSSTSFTAATLRGAAVKDVNFTDATLSTEQLKIMFGDASVTLPGGHGPDHASWPKRWSKENLDWEEFKTQWRAFQRSIGQDPMNPT